MCEFCGNDVVCSSISLQGGEKACCAKLSADFENILRMVKLSLQMSQNGIQSASGVLADYTVSAKQFYYK